MQARLKTESLLTECSRLETQLRQEQGARQAAEKQVQEAANDARIYAHQAKEERAARLKAEASAHAAKQQAAREEALRHKAEACLRTEESQRQAAEKGYQAAEAQRQAAEQRARKAEQRCREAEERVQEQRRQHQEQQEAARETAAAREKWLSRQHVQQLELAARICGIDTGDFSKPWDKLMSWQRQEALAAANPVLVCAYNIHQLQKAGGSRAALVSQSLRGRNDIRKAQAAVHPDRGKAGAPAFVVELFSRASRVVNAAADVVTASLP